MLRQGEAGGQATARGRDEFPLIVMHFPSSVRYQRQETAPPPWRPVISQRSKERICHASDSMECPKPDAQASPAHDAEREDGRAPLVRAAEHFDWTASGDVSLTRHARSVLTGSSTNIPPRIGTARQARTSESVTRQSAGPCQKTAPISSA